MLHIKSYVFGVEDFDFDTFRNVRGRIRYVGTRLGMQERKSTKNSMLLMKSNVLCVHARFQKCQIEILDPKNI